MLTPLDNFIINTLRSRLHGQRDLIINNAIDQFKRDYPLATVEQHAVLNKKLAYEIDRVYPIVDEAILQSGITRAKYTFWFITILSAVLMGGLIGFNTGNPFAFISPLFMAFFTWCITWSTIPIPYNARVRGAMNSTIATFVKEASLVRSIPSEDYSLSEFPEIKEKEIHPDFHIAIESDMNSRPLASLPRSSSLPNLRSLLFFSDSKPSESLLDEDSHSNGLKVHSP